MQLHRFLLFLPLVWLSAQPATSPDVITLQADRPGETISPTMFGIFFEDINFAADGGLYPELVKNRSFEFAEPLTAWRRNNVLGDFGELVVRSEGGLNPENPHYLRVRTHRAGSAFAISNEGFRGMGVHAGSEYRISAYIRASEGAPNRVRATLTDEKGAVIGQAKLEGFTPEWRRYESTIESSATTAHARLNLIFDDAGSLDLDMVSLFPKDTWRGRANGLRKDLVQLLADMKPGFIRFPGGCIVEGRRLELRYQWKKTIGDLAARHGIVNRWNDELAHRPAPDYFQSFGLGFFEYFQLAEDIGASPLPILNCGMACQFNSGELAPLDSIDTYIQDALDLIEFANGAASTRWGGLRTALGHPEPFHLKMIGIGNEQWGSQYIERYERFSSAIKLRYPDIALVAAAGAMYSGPQFEEQWASLRKLNADFIDEHYYAAPEWFLRNSGRYDNYPRNGPKVFAGEYAAQSVAVVSPKNRNNWETALAEAAFMTGLERNAGVVRMASYAPLFAHVDGWQWTPDLIWYDNLRSYGTPNYYVQKLYATNLGTNVIPASAPSNLYVSASIDQVKHEVILKAVNTEDRERPVRIQVNGFQGIAGPARVTTLGGRDLNAENSLDAPRHIAPVETQVPVSGSAIDVTLGPRSMTVVRAALRN